MWVIKMNAKLLAVLALVPSVNFLPKTNNFTYKYVISANSTSVKDMLVLYDVKQEFISRYNNLILSINESHHEKVIKDNINTFIDSSLGTSTYTNGKIVIKIGEGKGGSIEGQLRKNACDEDAINYRIYLFDLIFGK